LLLIQLYKGRVIQMSESPCVKCESKKDGRCRLERLWIDCSAKDAYEKRMKRENHDGWKGAF
jgi:hypothetical protein